MSVINPDEWDEQTVDHAKHPEWYVPTSPLIFLCLLDLARYGIRWGTPEPPEPEWVRCVDEANGTQLTVGRIYRVIRHGRDAIRVRTDRGIEGWFDERRFVPASADEATVTIDVPVTWARWMAGVATDYPDSAMFRSATAICREALTKAGLL